MELFAALLCAVRPFSGSPFPRPLVFIELVAGFVVWSAFAFVELGCFVRPVRAFVLSELPLLVTRSSPKKKKLYYIICPAHKKALLFTLPLLRWSRAASAYWGRRRCTRD